MANTDSELLTERSLLSILVLSRSKDKVQQLVARIDRSFFSSEIHQWIYDTIIKHFSDFAEVPTKQVFKLKLDSLIEPNKTETRTILKNIYSVKINDTDFDFLLNRLCKHHKFRQLLKTVENTVSNVSIDNIDESLENLFLKVSTITTDTTKDLVSVRRFDLTENILDQFARFETDDSSTKGIPTPINELNEEMGGLKKQQIFAICAPTGEGKSILLLNFADHAFKLGYNVLFFTIEMSYEDIESRLHSLITKVDANKILKKQLNEKEKKQFYRELFLRYIDKDQSTDFLSYFKKVDVNKNYKEIYDDIAKNFKFRNNHFVIRDIPSRCSIERMKAELKYITKLHPIDLIVVDYLNIIEPSYRTNQDWLDKQQLARSLKEWAREVNLPLLTAVQIKVPKLGEKLTAEDLKYSKSMSEHFDHMYGYSRTDQDKLCGRIRFESMKHRYSEGRVISIKEHFSTMGITNFIEFEDDINSRP